jgi:hypothetical protein
VWWCTWSVRDPQSRPDGGMAAAHLVIILVLCCWTGACGHAQSSKPHVASRARATDGVTEGFVLADIDWLLSNAQCPSGAVRTNKQNWEAQFPTRAARQRQLARCGGDPVNRGPNCENVWFNPDVIKDPLPFREATANVARGLNLDRASDGRETKTTCAHQKFMSPDGEPGIDNQFLRFFGCHTSLVEPASTRQVFYFQIQTNPLYRLLLEVVDRKDRQDGNNVDVRLYQGGDHLIVDAAGRAVPWQSQQIHGPPLYQSHGRITDGVLETEPADVTFSQVDSSDSDQLLVRGMRLRLKLDKDGAGGLIAGYLDVPQFWREYSQTFARNHDLWGGSGPSSYEALHRLADGYKDPTTGACTALSWAREYDFVRAYLIHPTAENN